MIYSTISDFLNEKSLKPEISFDSFCKSDARNNTSYISLYDYKDIFTTYSVEITLTDDEVNKYKYKPKLLSKDIYDYEEYYFIILFINDITSSKHFNLENKKIKMIKPVDLFDIINSIYYKEK